MPSSSKIFVTCLAVLLFAHGRQFVLSDEVTSTIPQWGQSTDPDGDCKFFVSDGTLLITVPGGAHPHDLAADVNTTNAPRVLQPVQGDFTMQVQIDGRFMPGSNSSLPGRGGYNGAGLVLMLDGQNVVTLARAVLHHEGSEPRSYLNFEIRVDGKLERIGTVDDLPIPFSGPLSLRLEQRGRKIHGAICTDGMKWVSLESKDLPEKWTSGLKAGVVAISTSKEEFNPRFSKLQLLK